MRVPYDENASLADWLGVALGVDDRRVEPVSGFLLTVVVHNRTAAETLEAVAALYSFPPDRWVLGAHAKGSG
jgi:hypothetical protein